METLYLVCAVAGGTILVLQTVLMLIGLGDHDLDVDDTGDALSGDEANVFFKVLSLKTVVGFVTFFGLTGRLCQTSGMDHMNTVVASVAAGTAALLLVYYLMKGLKSLQSTGTMDLENAVGKTAEVYLRIPAAGEGVGKVTLVVQGRSVECPATSAGGEIPTGARVQVTRATGGSEVEVVPLGAGSAAEQA